MRSDGGQEHQWKRRKEPRHHLQHVTFSSLSSPFSTHNSSIWNHRYRAGRSGRDRARRLEALFMRHFSGEAVEIVKKNGLDQCPLAWPFHDADQVLPVYLSPRLAPVRLEDREDR